MKNLTIVLAFILGLIVFQGCGSSSSDSGSSTPPIANISTLSNINISMYLGETKTGSFTKEDNFTYQIGNLPPWASVNETSETITVTAIPTKTGHGKYDIMITNTVNGNESNKSLNINVYPKIADFQETIDALPLEPIEQIMSTLGSIQVTQPQFFPNPDGNTWTVCIPYFAGYGSAQQIITVDLSTGSVGVDDSTSFTSESWNAFAAAPSINNKTYINPKSSDGLIHHHAYNTSTHTWQKDVVPTRTDHKGSAQPSKIAVGVNQRIYSLGLTGTGDTSVLEINPVDNTTRFYTDIPANGDIVGIAADNDYVYVLDDPYNATQLTAVNLVTNARTVLKTAGGMILHQRKHGVVLQASSTYYWLYNNEVIVANDLNNYNNSGNPPWGVDETDLYTASSSVTTPAPITEYDTKALIPAGDNTVGKFWYIDPNGAAGIYISTSVPNVIKYAEHLYRVQPMNNSKILFLAQGYSGYSVYDPALNSLNSFLPIEGRVSNYTSTVNGTDVYISGYFGGDTLKYDTTKEWTNTVSDTYNPNNILTELNPKHLGGLGNLGNIGKPYDSAMGLDGLYYMGGERIRTGEGGGLASYNPLTEENLGITSGFEKEDVKNIIRAGKYIVAGSYATDTSHPVRVSVYDTQLKRIVRTIDIAGIFNSIGNMCNASDDETTVYVFTKSDDNVNTRILKIDVETGVVEFDVSYPFVNSVSSDRSALIMAEDGFLYSLIGDLNILVRIDPNSGHMEPVRSFSISGGDFDDFGNDLYFAGLNHIRRVQDYGVVYNINSF